MSRHLVVRYLERTPYREGLALQKDLAEKRKQGLIEDTLLLLEHDPVITLGRNTGQASLLASPVLLESLGVDLVESDRGGDATFHGPGQIVGYPIIDLRPDRKDIRRYVRSIEAVMIGTLAHFGHSHILDIRIWTSSARSSRAALPSDSSSGTLTQQIASISLQFDD